ncbi:RND transporter [Chitinophagaceae bacterium IBVUCB1]|nr:RND transporter [Chitinophagaceae bacterium IBVUCB1]
MRSNYKTIISVLSILLLTACNTLKPVPKIELRQVPAYYSMGTDTINSAAINWRDFFADKNLVSLIDTALKNNPDALIAMQNIEIAKNNVRLRKGKLFPFVTAGGEAGFEKAGRYTSQGAGDASADITPGEVVPEHLPNYLVGLNTAWEIDVWGKLRNAKKAAFYKYLQSIDGRNLVTTNLVAEIANSYYELLSLDNKLDIIRATIELQQNALDIVRVQKQATVVTELAVKQFEAQVYKLQAMEYDVRQQITETENKINFLAGRFPQPIVRNKTIFKDELPKQVAAGIPSQMLANRPDIRMAEYELMAAKCDVKVAKAEFYPSFGITGFVGFNAFKTSYLFTSPQSLAYSLVGELAAPLVNRSAIVAEFNTAKANQIKALYDYQQSILNGYVEVSNELARISNLQQAYTLKNKQVETLTQSIDIAKDLFNSARADYLEVLVAQRDALDAKLELIETKQQQLNAVANIYKALGGGWK